MLFVIKNLFAKKLCTFAGVPLVMTMAVVATTATAAQWVEVDDGKSLFIDVESAYFGESETGDKVAGIWYRAPMQDADLPQLAWMDTLILTNCSKNELKVADVVEVDKDGLKISALTQSAEYAQAKNTEPFKFFNPRTSTSEQGYASLLDGQCDMMDGFIEAMQ